MSARYLAALALSPGSRRNRSASARCAVPSTQTPVRSPRQKLTPLSASAETARFRTSQPTDALAQERVGIGDAPAQLAGRNLGRRAGRGPAAGWSAPPQGRRGQPEPHGAPPHGPPPPR